MSTQNVFQKELSSFLQRHILEQLGEEEVPLSLKEKNSPLEEVISDYHRSLKDPGYSLERRWISSISENEFREAGVELYLPKIYRGLPRVYHREEPSRSRIKHSFLHLPRLRQLSIDRAVASLYGAVELKIRMKVVLFVWVISDGLGDWIAAVRIAEIIKREIPILDVEILALTALPLPPISSCPALFISYEKEPKVEHFTEAHIRMLREADLVIQTPTYFLDTSLLLERMRSIHSLRPMPQIEHLGEYGYLESSWFHPKTGNRSMGLHALEKGILIRKMAPATFAQVENRFLLEWLFSTHLPGPLEIDHYTQTHRFHLGYLATPMGGAIYLNSLLKMWERDDRGIDLCTPDLGWFIEWTEGQKKKGEVSLLSSFGLQRIEVWFRESMHVFPIQEKGKVLRLLCPGPISATDMEKLMELSAPWVGIRGDQSFSEAISAGQPFFYDGREHARYFLKDVVALAENRLSSYRSTLHAIRAMGQAFLWNLPPEEGDWVDETYFQSEEKRSWQELALEIGLSLQDPDAIAGYKKFSRIVVEEHSANRFLIHMTCQNLFHRLHPELAEEEKWGRELYGKGELPLSALVKNIKVRMMQL